VERSRDGAWRGWLGRSTWSKRRLGSDGSWGLSRVSCSRSRTGAVVSELYARNCLRAHLYSTSVPNGSSQKQVLSKRMVAAARKEMSKLSDALVNVEGGCQPATAASRCLSLRG